MSSASSRPAAHVLVVVFGLPGSGKSYLASRLAPRIEATYLSSDALRRDLIRDPVYSPAEKERVYAGLMARAAAELQTGRSVVLDATFHTAARRHLVTRLAIETGVDTRWVKVFAAEPVIRARLATIRVSSDADYAVYQRIRQAFEPMQAPHLRIESTQHNVRRMLTSALEFLRT